MRTVTIQASLVRETEKAVLLNTGASYKKSATEFDMWVPKSCAKK